MRDFFVFSFSDILLVVHFVFETLPCEDEYYKVKVVSEQNVRQCTFIIPDIK